MTHLQSIKGCADMAGGCQCEDSGGQQQVTGAWAGKRTQPGFDFLKQSI